MFYIKDMLIKIGFSADPAEFPPLGSSRAAALLWWRAENDHDGIAEEALRQAAALATVTMDDGYPAFGETFREFAEFVAEMPF